MEFCPTCGILLLYDIGKLFCPTCPYMCRIENDIKRSERLVKKATEPVMTKDDMKNAPATEASCPQCHYTRAAFQQIQIRSADEPMSIFYMCLKEGCGHQWRED